MYHLSTIWPPFINYEYGIIPMNTYNLKGATSFDDKFPFDFVVIYQKLLTNKVIIIVAPLIAFNRVSFTNVSQLWEMVCHSALRGMFSSM